MPATLLIIVGVGVDGGSEDNVVMFAWCSSRVVSISKSTDTDAFSTLAIGALPCARAIPA